MILVHAEVRRKQKAVRPELVEGLFCLLTSLNEERCFDRLSTNGEKESPRRRVNQMPSYRQGGAFSPCGLAVKISHPVSVMPMLCSNCADRLRRSEEHTSELQSLMRISYAVFCLKK